MTGTVARSTPYAWPYDGNLVPTRLALLVVLPAAAGFDAAVDGPAPGPALGRIGDLAKAVLAVGGVVVEVTTTPPSKGSAATSVPARRTPVTGPVPSTARIISAGIDGFFGSTLDATLRAFGRDQLLMTGQWLETNVHSTMRSANDRGYECLLVLDACIAYDPGLVDAARSQIEMSGGIFGAVGETAAVLDTIAGAEIPQERTPA